MKVRQGFVSNSSSSSFVVILPDTFDVNNIDFGDYSFDDEESREEFTSEVKEIITHGGGWEGDYGRNWSDIADYFERFAVAEFDTDSDRGEIRVLNNEKCRRAMKG